MHIINGSNILFVHRKSNKIYNYNLGYLIFIKLININFYFKNLIILKKKKNWDFYYLYFILEF